MRSLPLTERAVKREAAKAILRAHYSTTSNRTLAEMAGISLATVLVYAKAMGLEKPRGFALARAREALRLMQTDWNEPLIEVFDLMYPHMRNAQLAEFFGISEAAIVNRACQRGSRKAPKQRASKAPRATLPRTAKAPAQPKAEKEPSTAPRKPPPPMTEKQIAQHAKERFTYPAGEMPWRAQAMNGPAWTPPPLTYRGQQQRSSS